MFSFTVFGTELCRSSSLHYKQGTIHVMEIPVITGQTIMSTSPYHALIWPIKVEM